MKGDELRKRRLKLGFTQERLAKELEVTPNTIARWERGEMPQSGTLPAWVPRILEQVEQGDLKYQTVAVTVLDNPAPNKTRQKKKR